MISFDDLIDGLVSDGSKKGMNDIQKSSAKQKIMNLLSDAKEMASDSGIDFMALVKESFSKDDSMDGSSESEDESEANDLEEDDLEEDMADEKDMMGDSEEEDSSEPMRHHGGKSAKAHAMILMLNKKKLKK